MSKSLLRTTAAVAAIAVNFVPGLGTVAALGIKLGTGALLSTGIALASGVLLSPHPPKVSPATQGRLQPSLNPDEARKIVFGRTALATDVRYQAYTGSNQEYVDQIVACAGHQVQSIDEIWFDNEIAWTKVGGVQGRYAGYLTVNDRTVGTAGNAIAIDSVWTASCRLTGCAYVRLRYKTTGNSKKAESPFASSIPSRMTIRGQAALLYDPRFDGTVPGGSGPQRANDQSTWAYAPSGVESGRNQALQLLWYLLGWRIQDPAAGTWKLSVGRGLPAARIDLPSFITAANICDESVGLAAGGTEPRYRSDGIFSEADDPSQVIGALLASMNGWLDDSGGKLALGIYKNDLATPALTLSEADVLGGELWQQTPSIEQTFNVCRGRGVDPSDNALYQLVEDPPARLASLDAIDRIDPIDFGNVQSSSQRQRLRKQRLQRAQYQGRYSARFGAKAWQLSRGKIVWFSHRGLGWSNKPFRVVSISIDLKGPTTLLLQEEHAAIYAWAADESPPVQPAAPTVYDPLNHPLIGAISESRNVVYRQVTDPTGSNAVRDGDLWIELVSPMRVWARVGGSWQTAANYVTAGSHIGVADGATKNTLYKQATAPASPQDGDFWTDTSVTPNVLRQRISGAWQVAANLVTQGSDIGVANNATRNVIYRQTTDPAGSNTLQNGDIWVDISSTPMVEKVRIGGSWQTASNYVTQGSHIGVDNGATVGGQLGVNVKNEAGNTLYNREVLNDSLDVASDAGGSGGKGRVLLRRPNGTGGWTTVAEHEPHDVLQNKAITVDAGTGAIGGIGVGSGTEVANETMRVGVDTSGAGGRARVRLLRNGGSTAINALELPSSAQNLDIGVIAGQLSGIGDGSGAYVANDYVALATDTSGTGGRARIRITRNGGLNYVNSELPANVQNLDLSVDTAGRFQGIGAGNGAYVKNDLFRVDADLGGTFYFGYQGAGGIITTDTLSIEEAGVAKGAGTAINFGWFGGAAQKVIGDKVVGAADGTWGFAVSRERHDSACVLSARRLHPANGYTIIGITTAETVTATNDIPFGIYFSEGSIHVWRSGSIPVSPVIGTATDAHLIQIECDETAVRWRVSGISGPVHAVAVSPDQTWRVVVATLFSDRGVQDISFSPFAQNGLRSGSSGKQIGDPRNLRPITAMNVGYRWPVAPTYSASSAGTATITLPAATVHLGDESVSYNLMTVGVTGTPGTSVTYQLWFDETSPISGGNKTLNATQVGLTVLQGNNRVWPGYCTVAYPSSGTSSGSGGSGGGGGAPPGGHVP